MLKLVIDSNPNLNVRNIIIIIILQLTKHSFSWKQIFKCENRITILQFLSAIRCVTIDDFISFHLIKTFQNDSLLSSAQQTYGSRACQHRPPNNFNDAINSGSSFLSDFKWVTISVTFGRPIDATICCAFGAYLIARPPSSWSVFVSIARLKCIEKQIWFNTSIPLMIFRMKIDIETNLLRTP